MSGGATGEARLRFARQGQRTILMDSYVRAPLYASRPLVTAATAEARVLLMTSGGGLMHGDTTHVDVYCQTGAHARIGTVGATRLLPAGVECRQTVALRLEAGSLLAYFPEPLIPCADASYTQDTRLDIDAGATAILGEIIAPGRLGYGERFAYRNLALRLRVWRGGRIALVERLLLAPDSSHMQILLGDYTHLASLTLIGPAATAGMATEIQKILCERAGAGGVTQAAEGVLVVRVLGSSSYELQELLYAVTARYQAR